MRQNEYLLDQSFFEKTVSHFEKGQQVPQKLIVVEHAVVNSLDFMKYLCQHYEVCFIPKPKSIDDNVINELSKICKVVELSRETLKSTSIVNIISELVGNKSFGIIDIGGYFAPKLKEIQDTFKDQFVKVIEDTENGYQKYESEIENFSLKVPLLSVARSPLKLEEDYLVGHEIVIKSELFLADYGTTLLGKKALVIGFGKIGRSIAENLRNRGVIVSVFDHRSIRQAEALSHGFGFKKDLMQQIMDIDMLYIANGEKSVDLKELQQLELNHSLYSFSVTSAEDTFGSYSLLGELPVHGHDVPYKILRTNNNQNIILANSGNAINFTYTISTLSENVQLTQAEMAAMLIKDFTIESAIQEMDESSREIIAQDWLKSVSQKREAV